MVSATIQYFRPSGLNGVELLSCHDADFNFPRHFHPSYCIWLNVSGGEHYSQGGNSTILQPSDFGIVAPGEVHANRTIDHLNRSLMTFYVNPAQLHSIAQQVSGKSSSTVEFQSKFYRDPECLRLLVKLFGCLQRSISTLEKESAFLEVFSLLASRYAATKPQEAAIDNEKTRVHRVIELFHDRLTENISLGELARQLDCTPFHLIRFFKKESGLTPYAYLLRLRLEQARELIWQGKPLVDVAMETRFSDQSHLTRKFKALYGITPGECRRQSLNN